MWITALTKTHVRMVAKDPVALVRRFQKNVAYWELQEMAKGSWFQPDMIDHCRWNTLSKLQNDFGFWVWLELANFQPSESTIKAWGWLWIDFMCLRCIESPTAPERFPWYLASQVHPARMCLQKPGRKRRPAKSTTRCDKKLAHVCGAQQLGGRSLRTQDWLGGPWGVLNWPLSRVSYSLEFRELHGTGL